MVQQLCVGARAKWYCSPIFGFTQVSIRPGHRYPTVNDILPKLTNVHYQTLINNSSVYHRHRLDKKFYLTNFACQFGRHRRAKLPFGVAPAVNMFQHKIDEILRVMSNIFCITDDILISGYNDGGRDHDRTLRGVMQV